MWFTRVQGISLTTHKKKSKSQPWNINQIVNFSTCDFKTQELLKKHLSVFKFFIALEAAKLHDPVNCNFVTLLFYILVRNPHCDILQLQGWETRGLHDPVNFIFVTL